MSESKLLKSVLIGAIIGGTVSMFDRKTREHAIETSKKAKDLLIYYVDHREELQQFIEGKIDEVKNLYQNASKNVNTIISQIDEIKEIPENVQSLLDDTKNTFTNNNIMIN